MGEQIYWVAFSTCNGIGPVRFRQLLQYFTKAENAWKASEADLKRSNIGNAFVSRIINHRKNFIPEQYLEQLQKHGVTFLTLADKLYPKYLKMIAKPPYVLYVKGNCSLLQEDSIIAIVGTRKVTDYGKLVTEKLSSDLSEAGFVISSGLALGVDAIAHAATLDAKGKTIAVLGGGVDYCTPKENTLLYNRIISQGGAIISEVPLGQIPNKGAFPSRNRIIAGMSLGVVVTEGAEDSGSLITADCAVKANRSVFAVPGPITSSVSMGTNALIARGAKIVTTAKDILGEFSTVTASVSRQKRKQFKTDTAEEQKVLDLLIIQDMQFDEVVKKTGFSSSQVGTILSLLEMKGYISQRSAGGFALNE